MPNFDNYPTVNSSDNISQFDATDHPHRSNFITTSGGGLTYTQHGIYTPNVNEYEFYEIRYDPEEDLGGLIMLGYVDEGNNTQVQAIESELAPIPAAWGSSTTVSYEEFSDDPAIDYIAIEQAVEVVAFGTLTTFDQRDVPALKMHSTATSTIFYNDDTPPTEQENREIWWYSTQGDYIQGMLKPQAPFTGQTSFARMNYIKLSSPSLPVVWANFSAKVNDKQQVILNWQTTLENNTSHFSIQKGTDGKSFTKIGEQISKGNGNANQTYKFTDVKPTTGTNYYRIQQILHQYWSRNNKSPV